MSDDVLMTIAWRDFMDFALGNGELMEEFVKSTGLKLPARPTNGLEAMIDDATGIREQFVLDFAYFMTVFYWGVEGVPVQFLADAHKRFPPTWPPGPPTNPAA